MNRLKKIFLNDHVILGIILLNTLVIYLMMEKLLEQMQNQDKK